MEADCNCLNNPGQARASRALPCEVGGRSLPSHSLRFLRLHDGILFTGSVDKHVSKPCGKPGSP